MKTNIIYTEDELIEIWHKNAKGWGSKTYLLPVIPELCKYLSKNHNSGTLLDIGCGRGNKSSIFDKMGFSVTGIDNDNRYIAQAHYNYPHLNFQQHKINNLLPFEDNSFDVVFSCCVFQYLEHQPMLAECKRIFKKGGSLILIENLKKNPISKSGRGFYKITKHEYRLYPFNYFTYEEINNVKEEFKDTSIKVFHFSSLLSFWKKFKRVSNLLIKLDQRLLKMNYFRSYAWLFLFSGKKEL